MSDAKQSVYYNRLPDFFLGFDVHDKDAKKFLSVDRRDKLLKQIGVIKVPLLGKGHYTFVEIQELLDQSNILDKPAEGLYLGVGKGNWLTMRAKMV